MLKTNFQRNLSFVSIILLGIIYFIFLIVAFHKIFPGFTMQLIFLADQLKNSPDNVLHLIFTHDFILNISAGLLLFGLILKIVKSFNNSLNTYIQTRRFVESLTLISKNQYYVFNYSSPLAFTSGFIHPKIYISSQLAKQVSHEELNAVYLHESQHQKNHDPLKDFIVGIISDITPYFLGKNWLFSNYYTLVEINCDNFAQDNMNSKTPLVSALLKINTGSQLFMAVKQFSSQTDRIKILVDEKKFAFKSFFAFNSLLLVLFLLVSSATYKSQIFYECQHLAQCVKLLFNTDAKPVSSSSNHGITVSEHCLSLH